MKFTSTDIADVLIIEPNIYTDSRGFFFETWRHDTFTKIAGNFEFVQDAHSSSHEGTLRGLHYQIRHPQGKIVRVVKGEIFDVAVDLRKWSDTFSKWVGYRLSESNRKMLWIPPGFAHGFYVISDIAEITYKLTNYHHPEYERTILWNDISINIIWPIKHIRTLIMSTKDRQGIPLKDSENYTLNSQI